MSGVKTTYQRIDWLDYWELKLWNQDRSLFCKDFVETFASFVYKEYAVPQSTAESIGYALFERMSDKKLAYHTPSHIFAMFDFARFNGITLEPWEQLAIWFHDSVYIPGAPSGMNESCSATFFQAMMKPYIKKGDTVDYNEILKISTAINVTAAHEDDKLDPMWNRILDLDLMSYSLMSMHYVALKNLIRKEFDYLTDEEFDKGRKAFSKKLGKKGYVFRSPEFWNFEPIAIEHLRMDSNEDRVEFRKTFRWWQNRTPEEDFPEQVCGSYKKEVEVG